MLFSEKFGKVISNLGWIDKGNLWIYNCINDKIENISISKANYLVLFNGGNGYFSVLHVYDDTIEITVHHFEDPGQILTQVAFNSPRLDSGDFSIWKHVAQYYIAGFSIDGHFDFHLLKVERTGVTHASSPADSAFRLFVGKTTSVKNWF